MELGGRVFSQLLQKRGKPLKRAVFLHIQKTAGTTILKLVLKRYGKRNITGYGNFLRYPGLSSAKGDAEGSAAVARHYDSIPFVSGHFGYSFAKDLIQSRYAFTFLRDPVERIVSLYSFCRSRDPQESSIYALCHNHTFDEFLKLGFEDPMVMQHIYNHQAWQLASGNANLEGRAIASYSDDELLRLATAHLEAFDYVGFTETFERDRDVILEVLGIRMPRKRVSHNVSNERISTRDVSADAQDMLRRLTFVDHALYETARSAR